jgi:hypothetical protein
MKHMAVYESLPMSNYLIAVIKIMQQVPFEVGHDYCWATAANETQN